MVHYTKVINGIVSFIEQDMISKMNGTMKAWALGTAVALAVKKAPEVFEKLRGNAMVQALGLIDGEMVDIDSIYAELLNQAQKYSATIDFPIIGPVTYSSSDVEALYRLIMR